MTRMRALAALDRVDPALGMFIDVDADRVLVAAEVPRGGRLSGMFVAVKDLIDTRGIRTTYGSRFFADHVPERNAAVVDLLEAEGAIVFGKTNLNEFAYGVSGFNEHYGPMLAPADRTRTAGGSSGGSAAAVAAGVCPLAVGSDTSGSIRIPAGCCGVYGFKAAHGAVATEGVFPLAERYDSLGFFAASVDTLQLVLGLDELPDPGRVRVGRIGDDLELPRLPELHWVLFREQVWRVHGQRFEAQPKRYARDLQWKLAREIGDVDAAERAMAAWRERFLAAAEGVDVLAGPLLDGLAPKLEAVRAEHSQDEWIASERLLRHTPAYNALGWPALAVPTADGPLQLATRPGNEAALLAVGSSVGLPAEDVVVSR